MEQRTGRLYLISGRVQGVGYRAFAVESARRTGVAGWARNLPDGRVEVYAAGSSTQLTDFEVWLRTGPRFADVTAVEVIESADSDAPYEQQEFVIRS